MGAATQLIRPDRQTERRFFLALAGIIALFVLLGFAQSYYVRALVSPTTIAHGPSPVLSVMHHLHGLAFTLWVVLFVAQTWFISRRNVALHRRLGMGGVALALLMVVLATLLILINAKQGISIPGIPPLVFIGITLPDLVLFMAYLSLGISNRRRPDYHKRFMVLATLSILTAATARMTRLLWPSSPIPNLFMGWAVVDVLLIVCAVYDWRSRRRIHPVTLWAGGIFLWSEPLRLVWANTALWQKIAAWLVQWV